MSYKHDDGLIRGPLNPFRYQNLIEDAPVLLRTVYSKSTDLERKAVIEAAKLNLALVKSGLTWRDQVYFETWAMAREAQELADVRAEMRMEAGS